MIRTAILSCAILLLAFVHLVHAQPANPIAIPSFKDEYCKVMKQLEAGSTDVDFKAFRRSFLKSKQFGIKNEQLGHYRDLRRELDTMIYHKPVDYPNVIEVAKQVLSIDYTCMEAQKLLYQTYKIVGDTDNATKYHDIEMGLLHSIADEVNGTTVHQAWFVTQIEEEYFMLEAIDARVRSQSIDTTGPHTCDKMDVTVDGQPFTYYFDISDILASSPIK